MAFKARTAGGCVLMIIGGISILGSFAYAILVIIPALYRLYGIGILIVSWLLLPIMVIVDPIIIAVKFGSIQPLIFTYGAYFIGMLMCVLGGVVGEKET